MTNEPSPANGPADTFAAIEPRAFDGIAAAPYRAAPAWTLPSERAAAARPPPLRPVEIAAAVAIAAAADVAFWSGGMFASGGFGLLTLFAVVPAITLAAARSWRSSSRLVVVGALLAAVALRCAFHPTTGVVLSGIGLLFAFAIALRARRVFVPEVVAALLGGVGKAPSRVAAAIRGGAVVARRLRIRDGSVLAIVVPAGLVTVFLGVFALANPVVARGLEIVVTGLGRVIELPAAARVALWLVSAALGAVLLRPALRLARGHEVAAPTGEASATSLLVARNALVGLNVLFLGYNAIDARYLWTGRAPAGMHTQQYAHEGAFWLTIALLMLTAVVGVMFRDALATDPRAASSRRLAYLWIAQGLVLSLGTYRRIAIHIAKSGLSDLRIVGILGTSLVLCGLVLVAIKLGRRRTFTWLLRRQLDALAITTVLHAVAPTHLLSARVNVSRVGRGEYRPLLHAFRQTQEAESTAAYLPLLDHPDVRVRQGIAALLTNERRRLEWDRAHRGSWREQDVATGAALAALDAAAPRIEEALGTADPEDARHVLLEISRLAVEERSLEEVFAVPGAASMNVDVRR